MKRVIFLIACAVSVFAFADGSNYWYKCKATCNKYISPLNFDLDTYSSNATKEYWIHNEQYYTITITRTKATSKWEGTYIDRHRGLNSSSTYNYVFDGYPTNCIIVARGYTTDENVVLTLTRVEVTPPAPQFTNTTSAVEVKGWKRHYIYGKEDGTIHDPSGKVAPWVQAASISATTRELSQIADAARVTASNNLARMYAVTNQVTTFTKKIFVQAQLYPDLTKLTNCWGRVVKEWTDGTNDHCWVYFSRELKTAPVMKREYKAQTFTNVVEGVWAVPSFTNQSVMVDGYAGCKELIYRRPDNFVMKNCFTQPYLKWGTQEAGFNFGQRVFTIDDVLPFTGSWTNSLGKIWKFNNGTLVGEPTDVQ